jgi:predicted transcriptional regulator of viral defense system
MMYSSPARFGIEKSNRAHLDKLNSVVSGPFDASHAATILGLELNRARRLLAYFASRGWLARVRRGLYTTVPLGAAMPSQWREDPWVVATTVFAPCYIGGWSACEHWDLTEQIFRDIVVFTSSPVRSRIIRIQDTTFRLKYLSEKKQFGIRIVWRGQTRVSVSDPTRTIVDILAEPRLGAGIRNVADVIANYFESDLRNDAALVDYATRLGIRSVFKRLGYLIECLSIDAPELVKACLDKKSIGLSMLDPSAGPAGPIVKRWDLRINVTVKPSREV